MRHIRFITCHPSKIGMFHKDNPFVVFLYFVLFASILIGTLAVRNYNTNYFSNEDIDYVITTIEKNEVVNCEYKDYKITGAKTSIKNALIEIRVLNEDKIDNSGLIINLKESSAELYYNYIKISNVEYKNMDSGCSFTFKEVKNNTNNYNFRYFMNYLFINSNTGYASNVFLNNVLTAFMYYLIFGIVAVFIYSYFTNPYIVVNKRAKLVIYDSLIYFFVMTFTVIINVSFLQYVALFLPIVYCNFTFTHIIRVRK